MERMYNVPLRKEFLKVPKYKRAKKAVTALREFLVRHMKSENIIIGKDVNEYIWDNGIENPPHHVKIVAKKEDDKVFVSLADKKESKAEKEKKEKLEKKREKTKKRKEALAENKEETEEKSEEESLESAIEKETNESKEEKTEDKSEEVEEKETKKKVEKEKEDKKSKEE